MSFQAVLWRRRYEASRHMLKTIAAGQAVRRQHNLQLALASQQITRLEYAAGYVTIVTDLLDELRAIHEEGPGRMRRAASKP